MALLRRRLILLLPEPSTFETLGDVYIGTTNNLNCRYTCMTGHQLPHHGG